jgi:hypothetical protein
MQCGKKCFVFGASGGRFLSEHPKYETFNTWQCRKNEDHQNQHVNLRNNRHRTRVLRYRQRGQVPGLTGTGGGHHFRLDTNESYMHDTIEL